jgi:hypothetical protein
MSNNEVVMLFDPVKLVYEVKSSSRTNVGGEVSGGHIFRVEIGNDVSCTCMTPTLFYLHCSHIITACRKQGVLHEGSNYMSPYYSISAELKTWEPRFEPLLDPLQWPVYNKMNYVPNVATQKIQKGRRKKKRLCNELDDMKKSYGNDMYGSCDFDQIKNKIRCSVCHGEGHTMSRHKEGPKRNPRVRGSAGMNRRSRASNSIEVTHTSNIENLFYFLVCSNIICCICNRIFFIVHHFSMNLV